MKHILHIPVLLILIQFSSLAQVVYEPGYVVNAGGEKIECLIENKEWLYNPTQFKYKAMNSNVVQTGNLNSVKEFGVGTELKYIKAKVKIDRSSDELEELSHSRNPEFSEEVLFLKVLIEGNANLYSYLENNLTRFFFDTGRGEITQLVFKNYNISATRIGENNLFRQQLLTTVNCQNINATGISNLRYAKKELLNHFIAHNKCTSNDYLVFAQPKKRMTHLTIKAGVNMNWVNHSNSSFAVTNINYKPGFGYIVNLELEHIMPFNKNKWSFILQPGYHSISVPNPETKSDPGLVYQAITIPFGLRYSLYSGKESRILLNALWHLDFTLDSSISDADGTSRPIKNTSHLSFGLGFKHKRLLFEADYHPAYNILGQFSLISSMKSDLRLVVGYTLF